MLLSHAVLYAEARSYVAALADRAGTLDAALEYERVLLQIDHLHGGEVAPITVVPSGDSSVLYTVARRAIAALLEHPVDGLQVQLCLAMLDAAHTVDQTP